MYFIFCIISVNKRDHKTVHCFSLFIMCSTCSCPRDGSIFFKSRPPGVHQGLSDFTARTDFVQSYGGGSFVKVTAFRNIMQGVLAKVCLVDITLNSVLACLNCRENKGK